MSKWISFTKLIPKPKQKTKSFVIQNKENGYILGAVKWYGPFRQYSFFPSDNVVFEKTCLQDITDFIKVLMDERKSKTRPPNWTIALENLPGREKDLPG